MNFFDQAVDYFRSSKAELEKVSWPSKQDTIRYGTLVIVASVACALFFTALDYGLHKGVEGLISRREVPQNVVDEPAPTTPETLTTSTPSVEVVTPSGTFPTQGITITPLETSGGTSQEKVQVKIHNK